MTPIERLAEIYRAHDNVMSAEGVVDAADAMDELLSRVETLKVLYGDPNAAPMTSHVQSAFRDIRDALNDGSRPTKHRFKPNRAPK